MSDETVIHNPSPIMMMVEYVKADLSQASVAAALEAAAAEIGDLGDSLTYIPAFGQGLSARAYAIATKLTALITTEQHDALQAAIDAAVAEARAEDAAKIDGSAGVRIQDVAQYLIDHMPAYNSEHPCWEALQDATDDGADEDDCIRAWLRSISQIGAKP